MKTILVFAAILILVIALAVSLYYNYEFKKQIRFFDEARKWHRMAYKDDLTGLNNRAAFNQKIESLKQGERRGVMGILLFDIDDFKIINDSLGHLEGDRVLQTVATALSEVFSSTLFTVYRIGGDEFAVIAERVTEPELISHLVTLRDRFVKEGEVRVSKGYAMIGKDVMKAIRDADKMLYADKASHK